MKNTTIFFLIMLVLSSAATACDICGCGVGSYYVGILPEFSKKVIGIRYRHNTLRTHIGAGGQNSYLTTREVYRTAELWGGWRIGKRIRLMASMPFNMIQKSNQLNSDSQNGLGDISLQGFYQIFSDEKPAGNKLLVQSLWFGGGLKLPTGRYSSPEKNTGTSTANIFQLGTGSVDFMLNTMYDLRIQDAGINTNLSYKINTANSEEYKYGNKFSGNLQAYYKFRIKNLFTIAPNAGVLYETAAQDNDAGFKADVSGGYALLGTAGLEATFQRFSIGGNFQHPFSQQLANNFVKANNRAMIHFSILF